MSGLPDESSDGYHPEHGVIDDPTRGGGLVSRSDRHDPHHPAVDLP